MTAHILVAAVIKLAVIWGPVFLLTWGLGGGVSDVLAWVGKLRSS